MKKNLLSVLFISSFVIFGAVAMAASIGGNDAGLINSNYMKDIRTFDFRKENNQRIKQIEAPNAQQRLAAGKLISVSFLNNRAFSEKTLQGVVEEFIGQPMSATTLMQMRKKIMKFYQSYGYYSAVAAVESENPSNGSVTFRMQEGSKDSIQIDGD